MSVALVVLAGFESCRMHALAAVWYVRVLGYLRLEGQAEVDDWVEGMVPAIRCCLVAAFVFAEHRLPLKTSAVAGHWCMGDFEALALALRCIAAGR